MGPELQVQGKKFTCFSEETGQAKRPQFRLKG